MMQENVLISLGGNKKETLQLFGQVKRDFSFNSRIKIQKESSLYLTSPVGFLEQSFFLNQVIKISTDFQPHEFLDFILGEEKKFNRVRKFKNSPRNIDIDILIWNRKTITTDVLTIPHKELVNRKFILTMLNEIIPDYALPAVSKSIRYLLNSNKNSEIILKLLEFPLV